MSGVSFYIAYKSSCPLVCLLGIIIDKIWTIFIYSASLLWILCWSLQFHHSLIDWSVSILPTSKQNMKNTLTSFALVFLNMWNVPWRMVKGLFRLLEIYIELWKRPPMQSFLLSYAVVGTFYRKGKEDETPTLSFLASLRKLSLQSWCVLFFYRIYKKS